MTTPLAFEESLPLIRDRVKQAVRKDGTDQTAADAKRLLDEVDRLRDIETKERNSGAFIESLRTLHAFPSDGQVHRDHCDMCEALDDLKREQEGIAPYEEPATEEETLG